MKKSFKDLQSPVMVGVVKGGNIESVMAEIKNNSVAGADAFDVHISCLDKEKRTLEAIQKIVNCTGKPIMALHYNQSNDLTPMSESDDERTEQLLMAAEAGVACIDMQGYTFETEENTKATLKPEWTKDNMSFVSSLPNEVSLNPETIKKQKEFINAVHEKGCEVLLSTHTGCFLNCQQVIDLLDFLAERKPDILKLITADCDTDEQVDEYCKTLLLVKNRYPDIKVTYFCNGKKTAQTRALGVLLGAHIGFCVERYSELSAFSQLPLEKSVQFCKLYQDLISLD